MYHFYFRIQSESRSRERLNGDQQKRSLSYGDKLNNGNNSRRQLPSAPNNPFSKNTKSAESRIPENDESDLNVREPTPDYDTQSMASIIPPVESSKSKKRKDGRRSSADSNNGTENNSKRRLEGSLSASSSHGSAKETPNGSENITNGDDKKADGKLDFEEKGKTLFIYHKKFFKMKTKTLSQFNMNDFFNHSAIF